MQGYTVLGLILNRVDTRPQSVMTEGRLCHVLCYVSNGFH